MSTPAGNDYDRVAYPSMAHPQTFVDNLSVKGFLRGLNVAHPGSCRVLELGCGDGFNLAAMAALHPGSSYTGIDYAGEAITRGRAMMEDLGLKQVRLEQADIRKLDALSPSLGQFDYIMAHGVYSWVPEEVREALLATLGRLLAPHGIGFVSYLALPGAHLREMVRTIIRFHTRDTDNMEDKVEQARSVLKMISDGSMMPNHYTQWITDELKNIDTHMGSSLYHDELSSISAPLLFTDFLKHASQHGLEYLSEAECLTPVSRALSDTAREQLKPLESNRILLEQYLDFIEGRRFRQTLLCRPGLCRALDYTRLDELWIHCRCKRLNPDKLLTDEGTLDFEGLKKAELRAGTPATKAAMLVLAEHREEALPFPELLKAARARLLADKCEPAPDFDMELRMYFTRACVPGLVQFTWGPLSSAKEIPERPLAHPLARWGIAKGAPTGFSYGGSFVEVNGGLGKHLLSLLDGTRDHATLAAEMRRYLAQLHQEAKSKGETPTSPAPDDPALEQQLQRSLKGLAQLRLLRRS